MVHMGYYLAMRARQNHVVHHALDFTAQWIICGQDSERKQYNGGLKYVLCRNLVSEDYYVFMFGTLIPSNLQVRGYESFRRSKQWMRRKRFIIQISDDLELYFNSMRTSTYFSELYQSWFILPHYGTESVASCRVGQLNEPKLLVSVGFDIETSLFPY